MMGDIRPPTYEESVTAGVSFSPCINGSSTPYMNEGFETDEEFIKPPSAPPLEVPPKERAPILELNDQITEEDIHEACLGYVSNHCCYGNKFVRDMEIKRIVNESTFHYKLESFGEERRSMDCTTPYQGQTIDGPENGPVPAPWNVNVPPPAKFQNAHIKVEVPHTAVVRTCTACVGIGRVRCQSCSGRGGSRCISCHGRGRKDDGRCFSCSGTGNRRCTSCNATGQVKCTPCDGYGRLKHFKLLMVTWRNHVDHFVSETSNMPRQLVLEVTGKDVFEEESVKLYPINHCPAASINSASSTFIAKHEREFPNELILTQRHILRAVPVTRVEYSWKNREGEFYVYGFQREVYFEDYPQKCCCCTIL